MVFSWFKKKEDGFWKYLTAKDIAHALFEFPYQEPSTLPSTVTRYDHLRSIIAKTHKTTLGVNGKTKQTTIDAKERIRLQLEFKKIIFELLEECLLQDPEHAPSILLYVKVAGYNTRAPDRPTLINLYERFLPFVDNLKPGSKGYSYIQKDIQGMGSNQFDKVERHVADFYYSLTCLYQKSKRLDEAERAFNNACKACPKIYGERVQWP